MAEWDGRHPITLTGAPHTFDHRHSDVSGGWLRAATFGAMDGLVSNTALIAGVAVRQPGQPHRHVLTDNPPWGIRGDRGRRPLTAALSYDDAMNRRDMVLVGGGSLIQGSEDFYPEERPIGKVAVGDLLMDIHVRDQRRVPRFVKATGHITIAEQAPDPADFPGADPKPSFPVRWCSHRPRACPARRLAAVVALAARSRLAASGGTWQHTQRPRPASGGARRPRRRHRLRRLGGQASAHRSGVGVRGPRRPGRSPLPLGR